jgi:OCT family organic cation transporter-like MFS transporter 4/5
MEMVSAQKRVLCCVVIEVFFNLGEILASILAFWQRDWRVVIVMATLPTVFFLLYWPILPESTRWLLSNDRYEEAQITTNRISYWNKKPIVDIKSFSSLVNSRSEDKSGHHETMLDLLKDWTLFWRLMNMCQTWLVIVFGYYGLSLTSVILSGDPYMNFFLVSLAELPGSSVTKRYSRCRLMGSLWAKPKLIPITISKRTRYLH